MWDLPVAFYFMVEIEAEEVAFKEVSGLNVEMETEAVTEGGLNTCQLYLPKQMKHGNLVLKRGLLPLKSSLISWVKEVLEGDFTKQVMPKEIIIKLLNEKDDPVYSWTCKTAFPVKWEVDSLDSEKNSVLIETLEFSYASLKRS